MYLIHNLIHTLSPLHLSSEDIDTSMKEVTEEQHDFISSSLKQIFSEQEDELSQLLTSIDTLSSTPARIAKDVTDNMLNEDDLDEEVFEELQLALLLHKELESSKSSQPESTSSSRCYFSLPKHTGSCHHPNEKLVRCTGHAGGTCQHHFHPSCMNVNETEPSSHKSSKQDDNNDKEDDDIDSGGGGPSKDPWALLDPNEPSKVCVPWPLRVGVTIRLPPELDPRRFSAAIRDDDDELDNSDDDESSQLVTNRNLQVLKSRAFGDEFAYIAKAHANHTRKQERLQRQYATQEENDAEPNIMDFNINENDNCGGGFGDEEDDGDSRASEGSVTSSLGEVQSDQELCQYSSFGGEGDSFSVSGDEEEEDSGDEHEFGEGGSKSSQSREEEPTAGEFVGEDDANSDESQ